MFQNPTLKTHLEQSSSIHGESLILAEINMNNVENFEQIGNYRYRPNIASPTEINFGVVAPEYDAVDALGAYTGATDYDVIIDSGVDATDSPTVFASINERRKLIYSLEDCFYRFRPRSGINKAVYYGDTIGSRYGHNSNPDMMSRPRYYIADKEDKFKYWTSYRHEAINNDTQSVERGISKDAITEGGVTSYYIEDAAPFVVFKEQVPVNRMIIKMQTHVGTIRIDGINNSSYEIIPDPLYDEQNEIINRTVPIKWKLEYLEQTDENTLTWTEAIDFGTLYPNGKKDGVPIIGRDGYIEIHYGKIGGNEYAWYLPDSQQSSDTSMVTKFNNVVEVGDVGEYEEFVYVRGFRIVVETMSRQDVPFELIEMSPRLAADFSSITTEYQISKVASDLGISGLPVGQLLASTGSITIADYDQVLNENNMLSINNPTGGIIGKFVKRNLQLKFFEIIKIDLDDPTTWYYVPIKTMYAESFPEFDNTSRTATIDLRDMFFYFESMTAPQVLLKDVSLSCAVATIMDNIGYSNYIYLKSDNDNDPIIPFFFVPPETSVAEVLDNLAVATQTAMFFDEYNNFVLMSKKYIMPNPGDRQPNNPDAEVDMVFYGTQDFTKNGILKNELTANTTALANIKSIASADKNIFNDGTITYTSRYIQKSYGEIRQASLIDRDKTWQYKPVLLWEIEPSVNSKSINEENANQSSYVLSAIPLNSDLSDTIPTVENNQVINNVLDLGEGAYWIPRYNGYFCANGEMIKFDAVEYNIAKPLVGSELASTLTGGNTTVITTTRMYKTPKVGQKIVKVSGAGVFATNTTISSVLQTFTRNANTGEVTMTTTLTLSTAPTTGGDIIFNIEEESSNVWINNVQEYQDYFSTIPFNGKMYPTGRVRIYAEPYYETIEGTSTIQLKNGPVNKHGRGQFGTPIKNHNASLDDYWTNNDNIRGLFMESDYLFNDKPKKELELRVTAVVTTSKTIPVVTNTGVRVGNKVQNSDGSLGDNIQITALKGTNKIVVNKNVTLAEGDLIYISGAGIKTKDLLLVKQVKQGDDANIPGNGTDAAANNADHIARETIRTGIIKNFLSSSYYSEDMLNNMTETQTGTVQSSALVMTGSTTEPGYAKPHDSIAYIIKNLLTTDVKNPKLFGTRMRIIGRLDNNDIQVQTPYGANPVTTVPNNEANGTKTISASSGGIGFMIDDVRNRGYFFEIAALNVGNVDDFATNDGVVNVLFYKTMTKQSAIITRVKKQNNSRDVIMFAENSFKTGDIVVISGLTGDAAGYNGEQIVLSATKNRFSIKGASAGSVNVTNENGIAHYSNKNKAVPYKLWEGLAPILVDDGKFVGQSRVKGEENTTVYDLAVEYEENVIVDENYDGVITEDETKFGRKFYLYINGKLIGTVIDDDPLPIKQNIAPFIRGSSKVMFEKIYAVSENVKNSGIQLQDAPLRNASLFNQETETDLSFRKYSVEDSIVETYIKGISPLSQPTHDLYLDEFGTIMREAAYFNFRYEKAYPAFIAKIAPTFNKLKGYAISGFVANPYGAEFLVFNTTDFVISLDETSGNYLRILGVTFTQESDRQLTLDEFMKEKSDLSDPDFNQTAVENSLDNPSYALKNYRQIKNSRAVQGKNEFSIDSIYIQNADQAEDIMEWVIGKVLEPRLSVGLNIFPIPTLQLGDIVTINHKTRNDYNQLIDEVATTDTRFVVYNIEYSRGRSGPNMTIYLSEVS